jgi:hypothetical protein
MVVVILEDIERQRELFHVQKGKCITGSQFEKFLHLVNWAEYHLQQLEGQFQKSL